MSPLTNIQSILNAITESAAKICDAYDAAILLREGDVLALGAHHGPIPIDFEKYLIGRDWATGRAFVDRVPVHIHDLLAEASEFPVGQAMSARLGHRSILAVPLLRNGEAIGAIVIRRREVRPYRQDQIGVLESFANQAALAIENARQGQASALTAEALMLTYGDWVAVVLSDAPSKLSASLWKITEDPRPCRSSVE
jgi:GAF domain-containing protein